MQCRCRFRVASEAPVGFDQAPFCFSPGLLEALAEKRCDLRDVDDSDVVWVRGAKLRGRLRLLVNRECRKCGLGRDLEPTT